MTGVQKKYRQQNIASKISPVNNIASKILPAKYRIQKQILFCWRFLQFAMLAGKASKGSAIRRGGP